MSCGSWSKGSRFDALQPLTDRSVGKREPSKFGLRSGSKSGRGLSAVWWMLHVTVIACTAEVVIRVCAAGTSACSERGQVAGPPIATAPASSSKARRSRHRMRRSSGWSSLPLDLQGQFVILRRACGELLCDGLPAARPSTPPDGSAIATACRMRRAEGEMLKHEGRATAVLGAASRRRGASSGFFDGLLREPDRAFRMASPAPSGTRSAAFAARDSRSTCAGSRFTTRVPFLFDTYFGQRGRIQSTETSAQAVGPRHSNPNSMSRSNNQTDPSLKERWNSHRSRDHSSTHIPKLLHS